VQGLNSPYIVLKRFRKLSNLAPMGPGDVHGTLEFCDVIDLLANCKGRVTYFRATFETSNSGHAQCTGFTFPASSGSTAGMRTIEWCGEQGGLA